MKNDGNWSTFGAQTYRYLRGRTVTIHYDYHGGTSNNNKRQYRTSFNNGGSWSYTDLANSGSFDVTIPSSGQLLIEFYDANNIVTYTISDGASEGETVTDQLDPTFSCSRRLPQSAEPRPGWTAAERMIMRRLLH